MRFELILIIIAAGIMANIYTDGKVIKNLLSYKKYYQMMGVAFGAFMIYVLIKKNPNNAKNIIMTSNEYLKYLPVDRNTTSMISPILDFTSKHSFTGDQYEGGYNHSIMAMPNPVTHHEAKIMSSGGTSTKRSVSESKKKYVAHRQGWKCQHCGRVLPASFEVDHVIRLQHGGSNHIDNLVALCRDCHGEKTIVENL